MEARRLAAAGAGLVCLLLGGCDAAPPDVPRDRVEPTHQPPEEAAPQPEMARPEDDVVAPAPDDTPPPEPPPLPALSLADLRDRLQPRLRAAARAAPGVTSRPRFGNTGRAYEVQLLRAEPGAPLAMVNAAIEGLLEPAPEPFNMGYYQNVEPVGDANVGGFEAALRFERPVYPETETEPESRAALATALAREAAAAPGLAFFARAGWADAEGQSRHGVAFADPHTGEVLWVYVFELWRP